MKIPREQSDNAAWAQAGMMLPGILLQLTFLSMLQLLSDLRLGGDARHVLLILYLVFIIYCLTY